MSDGAASKGGDPRLDPEAVRRRFRSVQGYKDIDQWHRFTADRIRREVRLLWERLQITDDSVVLNAGAGNNDLGVCPPKTIHLDVSASGIELLPNGIVGNVESLPLKQHAVDLILCVGSVINYCDAAAAISEFSRVLRPGHYLILEFDSSLSAELLRQPAFGRSAVTAETFYRNRPEVIWVYTPRYIRNLLAAAGLRILRRRAIHIVSPWALLLTNSARLATHLGHLDLILRHVPFVSRWASNHLLFCQKDA
jgi:SAM-dependent methyltransferase